MRTPQTREGGVSPRILSVDFIEGGTFIGGKQDAYNFHAHEKEADFIVIRRPDLDSILEQNALLLEQLEGAKRVLEDIWGELPTEQPARSHVNGIKRIIDAALNPPAK